MEFESAYDMIYYNRNRLCATEFTETIENVDFYRGYEIRKLLCAILYKCIKEDILMCEPEVLHLLEAKNNFFEFAILNEQKALCIDRMCSVMKNLVEGVMETYKWDFYEDTIFLSGDTFLMFEDTPETAQSAQYKDFVVSVLNFFTQMGLPDFIEKHVTSPEFMYSCYENLKTYIYLDNQYVTFQFFYNSEFSKFYKRIMEFGNAEEREYIEKCCEMLEAINIYPLADVPCFMAGKEIVFCSMQTMVYSEISGTWIDVCEYYYDLSIPFIISEIDKKMKQE